MTRNKDLVLEHQEQEYNDNSPEEYAQYEEDLAQLRYTIQLMDLGLMVPSIATSEQIATGIIEAIKEGRLSPLEFAVKKKVIIDALDAALSNKEVKDMCLTEVEKYGKEGASLYGASIKITNTAKYDYDKDPKWKEINDSLADGLAARKAQEEKIKQACKMNGSIVSEDGEVIAQVVPCPKSETIAVSFKTKK
ncbi:MAG: hypothetical protein H0X41_03140 [Chitinophagaceae bacterium]|nr:hypothetical protein [Chitinophagaceae bacterium]